MILFHRARHRGLPATVVWEEDRWNKRKHLCLQRRLLGGQRETGLEPVPWDLLGQKFTIHRGIRQAELFLLVPGYFLSYRQLSGRRCACVCVCVSVCVCLNLLLKVATSPGISSTTAPASTYYSTLLCSNVTCVLRKHGLSFMCAVCTLVHHCREQIYKSTWCSHVCQYRCGAEKLAHIQRNYLCTKTHLILWVC